MILPLTKPVYYGLINRPPDENETEFLTELDNIIIELRSRSACEMNVCGDVNLDVHKPRDQNVRKYIDYIKRMVLVNRINDVTHIKTKA